VNSLDELQIFISKHFDINSHIRLEYYHQTFEEYVTLKEMDQIKGRAAKLRVIELASSNPWQFSKSFLQSKDWTLKGHTMTPYQSYLIKNGDAIICKPEVDTVVKLLQEDLHGGDLVLCKVYAIYNENLLSDYEHCMSKLYNKWRVNPQLFKKEDWNKDNLTWRSWVKDQLAKYISKFPWNKERMVPVVPMIHGTSDKAVWEICQTGFSTVSTVDDGWFGKGMYFTSFATYATKFYCKANDAGEKVLIISYVVPGNVYPVVESPHDEKNSLKGQPVKNGYQSHYTIVGSDGLPADAKKQCFDELVVFQENQVIPKYVVIVKEK